tara:strand:+ start:278 stop:478 length:201 start_codon:yes stop_codon:yes gene_type:complete
MKKARSSKLTDLRNPNFKNLGAAEIAKNPRSPKSPQRSQKNPSIIYIDDLYLLELLFLINAEATKI